MYQFTIEPSIDRNSASHTLVASVLLLTGIGLATLYSASYAYAERMMGDGLYLISRQIRLGAAGLVLFFIASRISLEIPRKLVMALIVLAAFLCILTFVPGISIEKNGAPRWIGIGPLEFQPSELVKLVLPLYWAYIFDKKQDRMDSFTGTFLPPALITCLFLALICLQNNISTAMFILVNAFVIFCLAGVMKVRYFLAAAVIALSVLSFLILTKEHRLLRLLSFIDPEGTDPQGLGFQVKSSVAAVMSGGFWGKGIGQGTRKIASVPEIHSDFIFSAFAEESGFFGVLLFAGLFLLFAFQGYRAALKAGGVFQRLLAFGFVTMICSQALLNVAVVINAVPTTGLPLPFFSAGGSSLVITLIMSGLVVNVSRGGPARAAAAPERMEAFNV